MGGGASKAPPRDVDDGEADSEAGEGSEGALTDRGGYRGEADDPSQRALAVAGAPLAAEDLDSGGEAGGGHAPVPPLALPEAPRGWTSGETEHVVAKRRLVRLREDFVGRRATVNALKAHAFAVTGPNPFVLTGEQGCGKSAAVAAFLAEFEAEAKKQGSGNQTAAARKTLPDMSDLRDQSIVKAVGEGSQVTPGGEGNNPPFVLYHSFSETAAGGSAHLRRVVTRMCHDLKARFGVYHKVPDESANGTEVSAAFVRFLAHASLFTRVVVVFDDLDRANDAGMPADWIPLSLPLAVRFFVVSNATRWLKAYCERNAKNVTVHKMAPTEPEERKGLMLKRLGNVLVRVDAGGASSERSGEFLRALYPLMDKVDAGRPLYLATALDEVVRRYRRIEEDAADGEVAPGALEALVADIAQFPDTTRGLFHEVLDALERDYGQTLIGDTITLLACARSGLQVGELVELLRENEDQSHIQQPFVEELLEALDPHLWHAQPLVNSPIDDTVRVYNSSPLFALALKRYLPSWQDVRRVHQRLAGLFESQATDLGGHSWRTVLEYFHQLVLAEDTEALAVHCTNPEVVGAYASDLDFRYDMRAALDYISSEKADVPASILGEPSSTDVVALDGSGKSAREGDAPRRLRKVMKSLEEAADALCRADARKIPLLGDTASFLLWCNNLPLAEDFLARAVERTVESRGVGSDTSAERTDRMLGELLMRLGDVVARQGRHGEAEETYSQAIALYSKLYGAEDNPFVAAATVACADAKRDGGNPKDSLELYVKGVALWEASEQAGYEGEDPTAVVRALCGLAGVCEVLNQCAEAEHAFEKSLEKLEAILGPDHPEVSEHLSAMAMSYQAHGEFMKSEFCFCRTLTFDHRFYSSRSLPVLRCYSNLAELHRLMGDSNSKHTLALFQRAMQICEELKGKDDTEVATYLNNAAELLRMQGNYAEAEPLYMRALAIDKEALGQASPTVSIRLNNLAELYRDQGRYDEAKPLYLRAISIDEGALGRSSPTLSTYLNNLAGCHKVAGELDEAETAYKRAIAIDEAVLGSRHPDIAIYLSNLAGVYRLQKRYEEAEPIYKRAVAITEEALGENHSDSAVFYSNLAMLYKEKGENETARPYYERAIAIGEMTLGADHPQVAKRLSNLGSLLFEMKHFDEAKRLFSRANTICTKALGANHADTIACRGWCDVIDSHIKKKSQAVAHANVHESEEEKQARKGKQTAIEPVASTSAQDQAGPSSSRFMQRRMSMEAMLVQLGMDQAYLSMAQQLQQQQMAQQMQMQMMRMQEQILELKMTQVPQRGNVDGALDDVAEAELSLAAGAPPFQSLPPVGVNTDISAIDLDAFLAAKTEYLGQRRYRCLLDGKVLSTFNLMRVHVARSFPGEIREFAAEQRQRRMQGSLHALDPQPAAVSPDPTPAPAAAPPLAGHSDPGGAPAAPSSAPVPDERMEKLERELNRLQGAISAQLGTTPAPAKVEQGPTAVASAPPGGARGGEEASSVQQTPAEARIAALENELRRMQASAPPALSATPVPFYTPNHGVPWSGGAAVGPAYSFYAERQAALDRVAALEGQYLHAVQQHPSLMAWATPAPMDRPGPGTAAAPSSIEPPAASSDAHGASAPPISAGGASLDAMLEAERGVSPFREGGAALIQKDAMRAPLGAGVGGVKDHMLALAKQGQHPPAATSAASAAKPHPLQSLMAQGQVDKVELFMCARSEQIGRRQFLCELDGHVLSTIDLLRAHFRKNYAREAEEWWAAQHFL